MQRSLRGVYLGAQSVYGRLAGYEDVNPGAPGPSVCASTSRGVPLAACLPVCLRTQSFWARADPPKADPWHPAKETETAPASEMNRFETEMLTSLKEPEVLDGSVGEVD
jgi:hypothetical protein